MRRSRNYKQTILQGRPDSSMLNFIISCILVKYEEIYYNLFVFIRYNVVRKYIKCLSNADLKWFFSAMLPCCFELSTQNSDL